MTRGRGGPESGFSLVEMLVALTITLIVSGAVYGLLSGGQSAFRREPALTDRQQNVRMAMNVIMRDVANAGVGMPSFIQTFGRNLDAVGATNNSENVATDELEILTNDEAKDNEAVCDNPGDSINLRLRRGVADVNANAPVMIIFDDGTWTFRNVVGISNPDTGAGTCQASEDHVQLDVRTGGDTSGMNTSGGFCKPSATGLGNAGAPTDCVTVPSPGPGTVCGESTTACPNFADGPPCCTVVSIGFAKIVRYRIRNDASGVPVLQRITSSDPPGSAPQVLATGIEDLQVQYTQAGSPTTWVNAAPSVVGNNFTTLINQVRVTLVSRTEVRNIAGADASASGPSRVRGSLTSIGSPRATLVHLANASTGSQWR